MATEQILESKEEYPPEFSVKPHTTQLYLLARKFGIGPGHAFDFCSENLPELASFVPADALPYVSWFAVLWNNTLLANYSDTLSQVHQELSRQRKFYNYASKFTNPKCLQTCDRTQIAMQRIAQSQRGDLLVIAAQLGLRWRGYSVDAAARHYAPNEFGLTSVSVASIVLVHPERLTRWEELDMQCAGDRIRTGKDCPWDRTPILHCHDDIIKYNAVNNGDPYTCYGSATAFLPNMPNGKTSFLF